MRALKLATLTLACMFVAAMADADPPDGPAITNPYFTHSKWRVYRDDATPIENVKTLLRKGKEKKPAVITLQPTPLAKRIYPIGPLRGDEPIQWAVKKEPSKEFAGVWDDVYASWSGLHGYIHSSWRATDGSKVHLRPTDDQFMHFVEARKTAELGRCGINFVHQSTTGMGHTLTNSRLAAAYERIYFSDCLVTAPAHQSFTEEWSDRTKDLYLAMAPTFFHSVGSSNSETMAITKLMIVGGYLPPKSKLTLKRNGLYPSALLYIWKAALPYDLPYDHEMRHRICYRALGREDQYAGGYGHAGGERGNLSLSFHRYDEIAHMRNMIRMAQSMRVLPPEAILDDLVVDGAKKVYGLKKSALVIQEPGQDVIIKVSTAKCYDLQERPIRVRWKLLYGTPGTRCEAGDEPDSWVIRVPWDDAMPEGRTAVALIANNGRHDGNPAIINVFRKRHDLPPSGVGYGDYKYDSPHANRRPVILDLQDRVVRAGETVEVPLRAIDPEGQSVEFHKRANEPGELDGNLFTLKMPQGSTSPGSASQQAAAKAQIVTFIASDGSAGNSYSAKRVRFVAAPRIHAHIDSDSLVGPAPFKLSVSTEGSFSTDGDFQVGWEFYSPTPKRSPTKWDKQSHGKKASHTFTTPGLYEVALTVKNGKLKDRETVHVWVTDGPKRAVKGGFAIKGNGVWIDQTNSEASAFNNTDFGSNAEPVAHTFSLFNQSDSDLICSENAISIEGDHAREFRLIRSPRRRIEPGGYSLFTIEWCPRASGVRNSQVTVTMGDSTRTFAVSAFAQAEPEDAKPTKKPAKKESE